MGQGLEAGQFLAQLRKSEDVCVAGEEREVIGVMASVTWAFKPL